MIRPSILPLALCGFVASALTGCDWMPGKPKLSSKWQAPTELADFQKLYTQNCLGCHSIGGTVGPAISMDNPIYLASITPEALRAVITNGVPGTQMPGFSEAGGGELTEKQIDILVEGILAGRKPVEGPVPPYSAPLGNPASGQALYDQVVAALQKSHPDILGDGFLTNPAFLDLVSDQYLRSLVIAGHPELGLPTYRDAIPGRPLTDQDVSDLTAWLVSQRKNEFGQPLVPANP